VRRFERERRILASLSHPAIAKLLDGGVTDDGLPFFVMEHVPGTPITEGCDRDRSSVEERLRIFVTACEAIHHAHQKGVIHRDVKPSNVLVTAVDGTLSPKVIDFGIAKALGPGAARGTRLTQIGTWLGTPGYMSPEQARSGEIDTDATTDIYSLGALLYELLAGTPPFDPKRLESVGLSEMLRIIQEEEPRRPSVVAGEAGDDAAAVARSRGMRPDALEKRLRGDLDWIVLKALEKDRARRYASASELAADVRRHLEDEPVLASPPTLAYRARKAYRRHRALFLASAAVLAAIVAGLVVATVQYARAEQARRDARRQIVRLDVAAGMRLADDGDLVQALPWFVEALRREEDAPKRQVHRYRIGATLAALPALRHLWGEPGRILSADLSDDGQRVAIATSQGAARVFRADTGEPAGPPLRHEESVTSVALAPDGERAVTGGEDGTARIWDVASGRSLAELALGTSIAGVALSSDGALALASGGSSAILFEVATGRRLAQAHHPGRLSWVAFSPSGETFLTAGDDGSARLWDKTGRAVSPPLSHDPGAFVVMGTFSPDGRMVATAGGHRTARVWDAATGVPRTPQLLNRYNPAYHASFSPDSRLLAVAGGDNAVHVWRVAEATRLFPPLEVDSIPVVTAFSPDGLLLAAGDAEGRVHLWRASTGARLARLAHAGVIRAIEFDRSSRYLMTAGEEGAARVWDLAALEPEHPQLPGVLFQFTPDARAIVAANLDPGARGWARFLSSETGDPRSPLLHHAREVVSTSLTSDGSRLVTGSRDRTARIWDAARGEPLSGPLEHVAPVRVTAVSPDDRRIGTSTRDDAGVVRIWDMATAEEIMPPLPHGGQVDRIVFSPDGDRIVTVGADETAKIWDAGSHRLVASASHAAPVLSVAMSPDGERIVTAADDGSIRAFRLSDGAPLTPSRRVLGSMHSLHFSADGARLVGGGDGGSAQVWDGRTLEPIAPPMRHEGLVYDVDFSRDRRFVVTASIDTTARIWDAETGEPVTPPYRHEHPVWSGELSPDGTKLLTSRVWELAPEERPIEDLELLSRVLSGRRLEQATATPILGDELQEAWRVLVASGRVGGASTARLHAWHRAKAHELFRANRFREALSHLDRALGSGPRTFQLLGLRSTIHAELRHWADAETDATAAWELIPGELGAAHELALLRLVQGRHDAFEETRASLVASWSEARNPDRALRAAQAMVLAPIPTQPARAQTLRWAEIALAVEPESVACLTAHGAALLRAGKLDDAATTLRRAVDLAGEGGGSTARAFLALAYRDLGERALEEDWRRQARSRLQELETVAFPVWIHRETIRALLAEGA
jgi:WD40 repeat protein/tetratricopeptide (TPR) repeat protein